MKTGMRIGAAATAAMAAAALGIPAASAAQAARVTAAVATVATSQTSATATTLSWPVLREGKNALWPPVTVRSLQYLLNARGAKLTVDGVFGPKTKAAVINFQRAHKLPVTGIVRAGTWKAMVVAVHLGSRGSAVKAVQEQANFRNLNNGRTLVVDGSFGPKTKAWVVSFQKAMRSEIPGFLVDGVVGPRTWEALVSEALSG